MARPQATPDFKPPKYVQRIGDLMQKAFWPTNPEDEKMTKFYEQELDRIQERETEDAMMDDYINSLPEYQQWRKEHGGK